MSFFRNRVEGFFVDNMTTVEESTLLAGDLLRKELQYARMRKAFTDLTTKQGKWRLTFPPVSKRELDRYTGLNINPWKKVLLVKNGLARDHYMITVATNETNTWTRQKESEGRGYSYREE